MQEIDHINGNQKTAGLATLISEKADIGTRKITRDKEGALHRDKRADSPTRQNNP